MMGKIISIDSYAVTRQITNIADKNPNTEMAIAGGWKIIDGTRIFLQHVLEYDGAQKQEWQVSLTPAVQERTHEKLAQKWYDTVAQWHQHLEKYNHAHDFSEQDEVSIKKQEVIDHTQSVEDEWLYIGSIHDREENIRIHRHWFYGIHLHKYALFLDFEVNRFTKIREFHLGKLYVGAVHYYPSAMPLRVVSIPTADRSMPTQIEFKKHSIKSYQESYAKAFAAHPFIRQTPVCLSEVKMLKNQDHWFLTDSAGFGMLSAAEESQNYKMMAYCLDPLVILLGEFSEKQFTPMSVFSQGYIKKI